MNVFVSKIDTWNIHEQQATSRLLLHISIYLFHFSLISNHYIFVKVLFMGCDSCFCLRLGKHVHNGCILRSRTNMHQYFFIIILLHFRTLKYFVTLFSVTPVLSNFKANLFCYSYLNEKWNKLQQPISSTLKSRVVFLLPQILCHLVMHC